MSDAESLPSLATLLEDGDEVHSLHLDNIGVEEIDSENEDLMGARMLTRSMSMASQEPKEQVTRRRSTIATTIQTITKNLGFWDLEFHSQRITIVLTMFTNYIFLIAGFLIALCVYWGAYYNRSDRYKNVKFAVMIADEGVEADGETVAVVGSLVSGFFSLPAFKAAGDFSVMNSSVVSSASTALNMTPEQYMRREVHRGLYKAAYFVPPDATALLAEALLSLNTSFNPGSDLLTAYYETGSDYNGVNNYFSSMVASVVANFALYILKTPWMEYTLLLVNSTQASEILDRLPQLLTSLPQFNIVDGNPVAEQVVQAPLQVGLIYLVVFTFFQFIFSLPIHMYMSSRLKGLKYVAYRIFSAQLAYFVLGFSYTVLNTAFGVKFDRAFGHLGFLVIWAFAFLTMSAVGSLIEILVLICTVIKPAMIGLVLLMAAVSNLAPTISPIVLCPTFYRYGYAMPVFNSYQLMQVAFFDSYKGHMGRNIGILVAWIVLTNLAMPFAMKWMAKQMAKKAAANKASNRT